MGHGFLLGLAGLAPHVSSAAVVFALRKTPFKREYLFGMKGKCVPKQSFV